VLIAKVSERDEVIDNVLQGSKVEEKLKTLPGVMQTLRGELVRLTLALARGRWQALQGCERLFEPGPKRSRHSSLK